MSKPSTARSSRRVQIFGMLLCATASLAGARVASAQRPLGVTDLAGRVSPTLEPRIRLLADSATAARLPVSPLIDKALEGASKHAPDDRIVAVVHSVLASLRVARGALGPAASDAELAAGVVVLRAGVPADALTDARRRLPGRPLTVPLSVLGSLVAAGVAPAAATSAVVAQATRASDPEMLAFGREVERSIAAGMPASGAVSTALEGPTPLGGQPHTVRPKP